MHARVSTYTGTSEKVAQLVEQLDQARPALNQLDGFQGAYVLVDRSSGNAMTITLWSSEQTAQASAESATRMRSTAAEASGYTIQSVATYEVGLQLGKE